MYSGVLFSWSICFLEAFVQSLTNYMFRMLSINSRGIFPFVREMSNMFPDPAIFHQGSWLGSYATMRL